jgi:hypothetical protein
MLAPITPAAAASWVFSMTSPKNEPALSNVEPPLKPNQPIHRITTPRPTSGIEWPGIARALPSGPYLPLRAPSSSSAASAPTAPVRWTTDEPAKSMTGLPPTSDSRPPPQTACAISG